MIPPKRLSRVDQFRGLALCMMIIYHFLFDLNYFHLISLDLLGDWRFRWWRNLIVSCFVITAGWSQGLSRHPPACHFWKRQSQLALACLLVSAVTYALFGPRWIYFGVLHFFLVSRIVSRPIAGHSKTLILLGILILLLSTTIQEPFFNPRWINWIGLVTIKPQTEDYAPLIPWLGLYWIALGVQGVTIRNHSQNAIKPPTRLFKINLLTWMGKNSLLVYLIHQPILFALLWFARWI